MPKKEPVKKIKKTFPLKGAKIEISIIKDAPKDKEFKLADGKVIKDVRELALALGEMADDIFWYHVNDTKNDFSTWIKDVFNEEALADDLKKVKDKVNSQITILKHIVKKIR